MRPAFTPHVKHCLAWHPCCLCVLQRMHFPRPPCLLLRCVRMGDYRPKLTMGGGDVTKS